MKKIKSLSLLMLLTLSIQMSAQKLHQIIFCNTLDKGIGASCVVDMDRAVEEISDIGGYIGYDVVDYVYKGQECTRQNLLKVLNSLQCSSNDIVIFYYSGHGVHANGAFNDKFPQMCMKYNNSAYESEFVSVKQVNEILNRKSPRLRIIVTDCCNNIDESNEVKIRSALESENGVTVVSKSSSNNYKKLFVDTRGSIIVTSSKLGQFSGCNVKDGGLFSYSFWSVLYDYAKGSISDNGWEKILTAAKQKTLNATNDKQEPYYELNINSSPSPGGNVGVPAPSPAPPTSTTSSFAAAMQTMLSMNDMTSRLNYVSDVARNCFGGNEAVIITKGRNLTTTVDYEDGLSYLNRIATSKNILRINVIRQEQDNNGKLYITVTEMRME